jgi:electron transfer flavoprotein-quinone oxidoreductase
MGYAKRLEHSYVLKDMAKYRRFPHFLQNRREIFTTLPALAASAAREMLTVNGVAKKEKQRIILGEIRDKMPLRKLLRFFWDAWRSVR